MWYNSILFQIIVVSAVVYFVGKVVVNIVDKYGTRKNKPPNCCRHC